MGCRVHCPQRIYPKSERKSAEDGGRYSAIRSQPDGMSRVKTARRSINSLPAWRPLAGIIIVRRGVESQPGDNGEGMTLARVNGDPFASAALSVAAELG